VVMVTVAATAVVAPRVRLATNAQVARMDLGGILQLLISTPPHHQSAWLNSAEIWTTKRRRRNNAFQVSAKNVAATQLGWPRP
jgi:hypothetical protein